MADGVPTRAEAIVAGICASAATVFYVSARSFDFAARRVESAKAADAATLARETRRALAAGRDAPLVALTGTVSPSAPLVPNPRDPAEIGVLLLAGDSYFRNAGEAFVEVSGEAPPAAELEAATAAESSGGGGITISQQTTAATSNPVSSIRLCVTCCLPWLRPLAAASASVQFPKLGRRRKVHSRAMPFQFALCS